MSKSLTSLAKFAVLMALSLACMFALSACQSAGDTGDAQQSGDKAQTQTSVNIGTLATEDFLPMWKAESDKLFEEAGLEVNITKFNSAQELSAALAAKAIDGAMTDIPVAATLSEGGTPMTVSWVTLGQEPNEGRFGIMVGPNSRITDVKELASTPIGVGSGTMLEYVMDKLLLDAGLTQDQIQKEELKKLPVRLQMVMQGEVAAGIFPASLLALGESQGAKVLVDDTSKDNLSQSIMAFRTEFAQSEEGKQAIEKLKGAWDSAVESINKDPEAQRELMLANAKLPDSLKDSYPVPHYPKAQKPDQSLVQSVLDWMKEKAYITSLTYDPESGKLKTA